MNILQTLNQLRYPREFRIAPSIWPVELEQVLARLAAAPESGDVQSDGGFGEEELKLLADVGTGLWRIRRKMVKPGTDQPYDEMRKPYRHLESVWDSLAQAGLKILDHSDQPWNDGFSLKVLAYQPTPGLSRDRILDTISPTIYFRDKPVQMGEVIVGTVESVEANGSAHS